MVTKIDLGAGYAGKLAMRKALYEERQPTTEQQRLLKEVHKTSYRTLAQALLERHLTFEESFTAACFAMRASNGRLAERYFGNLESFGQQGDELAARELLSALAVKEAWGGLTSDEVAGLVAGAMLDVMRLPDYGSRAIETCGMGGDKGVVVPGQIGRRKTINSSTLSALLLASMGYKAVKHGSYSNTSAMGSTDAIERLGLVVDYPSVAVQSRIAANGFHYTDAHAWKTIHDLSHVQPRRETVNHVIGPMTVPVALTTRLDKVLGVSDKMKPEIIAHAYASLHKRGILNIGNVAVVSGLHGGRDSDVILDELSPWSSRVAFVFHGYCVWISELTPADFGVEFRNPYDAFVENKSDVIHEANLLAMAGADEHLDYALSNLLAMNAALALYVHERMDGDEKRIRSWEGPDTNKLKECFRACREAIDQQLVVKFLDGYKGYVERLISEQ